MDAIAINKSVIRCDAKGCDYEVSANPRSFHEFIDRPCPVCGANLLTKEDYSMSQILYGLVGLVNQKIGDVAEGSKTVSTIIRSNTLGGLQRVEE